MENIELIGKTHFVLVSVFFLFFLFKTILLLINKKELLTSIREKTKVIDMVLGVLILGTGIYMLIMLSYDSPLIYVKAIIALAAIPLGIVGMLKENKLLSIVALVCLFAAFGMGEAKPWNKKGGEIPTDSTAVDSLKQFKIDSVEIADNKAAKEILEQNIKAVASNTKEIYMDKCANCHGADGTLGKFNATNLKYSTMNYVQRKERIENGIGVMRAYKDELTSEEIEGLNWYLEELRR